MKRKPYRSYSRDFKVEAVRLAEEGQKPVAAVARELGVHRNQIARWKTQLERQQPAASGDGQVQALQEELERLRRENASLTEENAVLRKAAMYFARESK
ncbi:MAG TPA: transposase [Burkholderiales bacterium]|nr:transposase [Burkholderiales bacterium]